MLQELLVNLLCKKYDDSRLLVSSDFQVLISFKAGIYIQIWKVLGPPSNLDSIMAHVELSCLIILFMKQCYFYVSVNSE